MYKNMEDKSCSVAQNIIMFAKDILTVNFRFMDCAINRMDMVPEEEVKVLAADGMYIRYNPTDILRLYKQDKNNVTRTVFHSIMHCVFQHFYVSSSLCRDYWDLATDIAIENCINELEVNCLSISKEVQQFYEIQKIKQNVKFLTAEHIYRYFVDNCVEEKEISHLKNIFVCDDHDIWYEKEEIKEGTQKEIQFGDRKGEVNIQTEWKNIAQHIQMDLQYFNKNQGNKAGYFIQGLSEVIREKYDYVAFLKKFAALGEELKANNDEFDYILYTYGLQVYRNMPLIEPLEYKEVRKVKEFVIVIDTSGSTSGKLVQQFIQKTYNILKQEDSFASKTNIHIIQCDAMIQEDYVITCQEEFDRYLRNIKIRGLGGTDFRPAFSYVDELISGKKLTNLKGMIYFTDGYGTFPSKQPEYKVAVVYMDDADNNPQVPVWAMKLILKAEEI